jgi:hypothetical protein
MRIAKVAIRVDFGQPDQVVFGGDRSKVVAIWPRMKKENEPLYLWRRRL